MTYSLTERAIGLVPLFATLSEWGVGHLHADDASAARTAILVEGGRPLWETFMDELREVHLGPGARLRPPPVGPTVTARLNDALTAG